MGVKSAERALAVLEFLRQRPPATLGEVAAALGMPNSSASVLLKTLISTGYVAQCARTRRFRQTYRVALLGAGPSMDQDTRFGQALETLHRATGETVVVGLQSGAFVKYIHLIDSKHHLMDRLPVDQVRLMSYNALGRALSAELPEPRVRAILRHNNAHTSAPDERIDEGKLIEDIATIRCCGYAEAPGRTWPSARVIAMSVHVDPATPPLAVGVGGTHIESRRDDIVACMRDVLARWH